MASCAFEEFRPFSLSCQISAHRAAHTITLLSLMSVGSVVISRFVLHNGNVSFLIVFVVRNTKIISILSIFSKNPLLFWQFSPVSFFYFIAFSPLFSPFCLISVYFAPPHFLKWELRLLILDFSLFEWHTWASICAWEHRSMESGFLVLCSSSSSQAPSPPGFLFHVSESSYAWTLCDFQGSGSYWIRRAERDESTPSHLDHLGFGF